MSAQPRQSEPMTLAEWDGYLSGIADAPAFILAEKFEDEDGQMLARILADKGWPSYPIGGMYAKAGDESNRALRRLQRKYHAALKLLAAGAVALDEGGPDA